MIKNFHKIAGSAIVFSLIGVPSYGMNDSVINSEKNVSGGEVQPVKKLDSSKLELKDNAETRGKGHESSENLLNKSAVVTENVKIFANLKKPIGEPMPPKQNATEEEPQNEAEEKHKDDVKDQNESGRHKEGNKRRPKNVSAIIGAGNDESHEAEPAPQPEQKKGEQVEPQPEQKKEEPAAQQPEDQPVQKKEEPAAPQENAAQPEQKKEEQPEQKKEDQPKDQLEPQLKDQPEDQPAPQENGASEYEYEEEEEEESGDKKDITLVDLLREDLLGCPFKKLKKWSGCSAMDMIIIYMFNAKENHVNIAQLMSIFGDVDVNHFKKHANDDVEKITVNGKKVPFKDVFSYIAVPMVGLWEKGEIDINALKKYFDFVVRLGGEGGADLGANGEFIRKAVPLVKKLSETSNK